MLSVDIVTQFRDRGDEIRLHPLNFREFRSAHPSAPFDEAWREYMIYGGLPRICSLTNPTRIANTFASIKGRKIDPDTIQTYLRYFQDAFLIEPSGRYDIKGRKYINSTQKIYFSDLGLRNARLDFRQLEETHLMENALYNELRLRGFSVNVGVIEDRRKSPSGKEERIPLEVDSVAQDGYRKYYLQSALNLDTPEKRAQEIRSLTRIPDSFKKIIIVRNLLIPYYDENGIFFIGLEDFLMNPDSLNA